MDGADKDLGWEDVGSPGIGSGPSGQVGSQAAGMLGNPMVSDAVTNAMVNHFQKELMQNSLSMWPAMVRGARKYFNVTHGYVLRKLAWQLVPLPNKKAKSGEITGEERDSATRIFDGLQQDIEEPDLYIPIMGFITYILGCGLITGLNGNFHPDALGATMSFAFLMLMLEVGMAKAVLYVGGAPQAPVADLAALLSYKYMYLSLQIVIGVVLGWGKKPQSFLFTLVCLAMTGSCVAALFFSLKRLARMQPGQEGGQESVSEIHKIFMKALPALQIFLLWLLMPRWPVGVDVVSNAAPGAAKGVAEQVVSTTIAAVTTMLAGAADGAES